MEKNKQMAPNNPSKISFKSFFNIRIRRLKSIRDKDL